MSDPNSETENDETENDITMNDKTVNSENCNYIKGNTTYFMINLKKKVLISVYNLDRIIRTRLIIILLFWHIVSSIKPHIEWRNTNTIIVIIILYNYINKSMASFRADSK